MINAPTFPFHSRRAIISEKINADLWRHSYHSIIGSRSTHELFVFMTDLQHQVEFLRHVEYLVHTTKHGITAQFGTPLVYTS